MPAKTLAFVVQRWQNGTVPSSTSSSSTSMDETKAEVTPSSIPEPVYEPVTVVAAAAITTKPHASVPTYVGSAAAILSGYCTEPAYTILDGPTALWVPVIGCISSKADCCPTRTGFTGAEPTATGTGANGPDNAGGGVAFPISAMPMQGSLIGCPKDYHTVEKTACCPSSYWLWNTDIGGQVPCYSSLEANMLAPPMPDTLVKGYSSKTKSERTSNPVYSITASQATAGATALTLNQKPTSAILNVAFAMQYPLASEPKPALKKEAKIGIGLGVSGAAIMVVALVFLVLRSLRGRKKRTPEEMSVDQRFGVGMDMSLGAHQPRSRTLNSTTHGGVKYDGVSRRAINF